MQAWIDGTPIACIACEELLDRADGAWRHEAPTAWCTYTLPAVAWLTDTEALDQIAGLLAAPQWPRTDLLDVINDIVIRTGRPVDAAAQNGWYDEPGAIEDGQ